MSLASNNSRLIVSITTLLLGCVPDTSKDVLMTPPSTDASVIEEPIIETKLSKGQLYVQKVMDACGARMSEAKRNVLSGQIHQVASQLFDDELDQRWFYTLICIESRFSNEARSSVGAVGLTQVMPQFAKEFARNCGLGELDVKDLADSQVNLLVGGCRFKELMLYYEGDVTLALAAYNSGQGSSTVKKAASSDVRTGHPETIGYLAAAFVLDQKMHKVIRYDQGKAGKTP